MSAPRIFCWKSGWIRMKDEPCPCGSGASFDRCCRPWLEGEAAPTAEMLMRSRYTAYVLGRRDYLRQSWHVSTRPTTLLLSDEVRWLGLKITDVRQGTAGDVQGEVRFEAAFIEHGRCLRLHEQSRFMRVDGRWYYVDGDSRISVVGRNEPCPCGSGRKSKRCCMAR